MNLLLFIMTDEHEKFLRQLKISIQENQYIVPSYLLYGGQTGYHNYGILGHKLKDRLIHLWRKVFINEDEIYEIETPKIIPYEVLKTSGHVDRFTDWVFYDDEGGCHRVDQLLKTYYRKNDLSIVDKIDSWNKDELENQLNILLVGTIDNSNKEGKPQRVKIFQKNLMFEVGSVGHTDMHQNPENYLRPELAQSIFVNFQNITNFLQKDPPFGICEIGSSYRREINPVSYIRMREFYQAEIEYFVDPQNKVHPDYDTVSHFEIPLLCVNMQTKGNSEIIIIKIQDAVNNGIITNKVVAYFIGKIFQFCMIIGLKADKIRFRQHMNHEMAHYANQCWDLETLVSDGWLECIGCADRGAYDLTAHSVKTPMCFRRQLKEPVIEKIIKIKINQKIVAQRYSRDCTTITKYLEELSASELVKLKVKLDKKEDLNPICVEDRLFVIDGSMINIFEEEKKHLTEIYVPHVIEPSFGVDRLIYSVLEQSFWQRPFNKDRPNDQLYVLSLKKQLTPYTVSVFQLSNHKDLIRITTDIKKMLLKHDITVHVDNSNCNIGKRYVRADEMGIKYVITVDFITIEDKKVTIRDRDTMIQTRVSIEELPAKIAEVD
jgi:glycyl-tRNA synthetase